MGPTSSDHYFRTPTLESQRHMKAREPSLNCCRGRAWISLSSRMGHGTQGQEPGQCPPYQTLYQRGCSSGGAACGGCELSLGAGQRGRVAVRMLSGPARAPLFLRPAQRGVAQRPQGLCSGRGGELGGVDPGGMGGRSEPPPSPTRRLWAARALTDGH